MLYFSRWKALSILLTAAVICAFAVPNFVSPRPGQEMARLGAALRGARSRSAGRLAYPAAGRHQRRDGSAASRPARGGGEDPTRGQDRLGQPAGTQGQRHRCVRLREDDKYQTALAKLRETPRSRSATRWWASPASGRSMSPEAGGGFVRLAPTEAATNERIRQIDRAVDVPIIEKRINGLGLVEPTIQREGVDRVLVQVPGLGDPKELRSISSARPPRWSSASGQPVGAGVAGAAGKRSVGSRKCPLRVEGPEEPYSGHRASPVQRRHRVASSTKRFLVEGAALTNAKKARISTRTAGRTSTSPSTRTAPGSSAGSARRTSGARSRSCSTAA